MAYWYRCDSYYIVLYSTMGVLAGVFNIMVDYGAGLGDKRQRLSTCIQDYLENVLWKRLGRDRLPDLEQEKEAQAAGQAAASKEPVRLLRGRKREEGALNRKSGPQAPERSRSGQEGGPSVPRNIRDHRENTMSKRGQDQTEGEAREPEGEKEAAGEAISQLRKSLEQAAAGRSGLSAKMPEKGAGKAGELSAGENWMKDLKPEEIKVLGEIIREYLG